MAEGPFGPSKFAAPIGCNLFQTEALPQDTQQTQLGNTITSCVYL